MYKYCIIYVITIQYSYIVKKKLSLLIIQIWNVILVIKSLKTNQNIFL